MELWLNLLFGNPIGLMSMIVVFSTIVIGAYIMWMFIKKSRSGSNN